VLLVSESEKNSYEPMDTDKQIATLSQQIPKKITDGMSNPEKWIYYIFHKNLRLE
jgi:hypothetical protein